MRNLNKARQKSIIGSCLLAWLLITTIPIIHANTKNSLQKPGHSPLTSMDMFNNASASRTPSNSPNETNESSSTKNFYHCPLRHCVCLLFSSFPPVFDNYHSTLISFFTSKPIISSCAIFFKQPRSQPISIQYHFA
jgi:hypothetical protein